MPEEKMKKVKCKVDPWAAFKGKYTDARDWAQGTPDGKKVKNIEFDIQTPEMNSKTQKKADEARDAVVKMGVIMFTQQVCGVFEDKKMADDKKVTELKSLLKDLAKDLEEAVNEAVKDTASGKADAMKSLKDCEGAFKEFNKANITQCFAVPRERAIDGLDELAKAGRKGDPDQAAVDTAIEALDEAIDEFEENGKTVSDAISTLLSAAKSATGNSSVEEFGKKVQSASKSSDFEGVVDLAGKFGKALEKAKKELEGGKTDASSVRALSQELAGMSALDKKAETAAKAAAKLEKDFKAIKTTTAKM